MAESFKKFNINGVEYDFSLENIHETVVFVTGNGSKYQMSVDDNGEVKVELIGTTKVNQGNFEVNKIYGQNENRERGGIFINSLYCGGMDSDKEGVVIDSHSFNPCSHNFVELCNTTRYDFILDGCSLQYKREGDKWTSLPLHGILKSGSTFLVRGSQCSVLNADSTVIKVTDYDMEWSDNSVYGYNGTDGFIQFSALGSAFFLTYGVTPCNVNNPYMLNAAGDTLTLTDGYIDLVGLHNGNYWGVENVGAWEGGASAVNTDAIQTLSSDRLFVKYYSMDPAKGAYKEAKARKNATNWNYVDITKVNGDIIPNIEAYVPRSSKAGKNFFYNKSLLLDNKPTIVTCSYGIKGTASGNETGGIVDFVSKDSTVYNGATRCFNWVSKDFNGQYLWIKKHGEENWSEKYESIYVANATPDSIVYYYNRIRQEYTDGNVLVAHKQLLYNIPEGKYDYIVGRSDANGKPLYNECSDIKTFTVYPESISDNLTFVQTSDQQGFLWDEYQMWKYSADYIVKTENPAFMINTGDMTQNGNRINEWIDYFNGKGELSNIEEMATIGNNDLSPKNLFPSPNFVQSGDTSSSIFNAYGLGFGSDNEKTNPKNITFYYTFELDEENLPVFDIVANGSTVTNVYVASLYSFNVGKIHFICVNSEITKSCEKEIYGLNTSNTDFGYVYEKIEEWLTKDMEIASKQSREWNILYCHEMPFTILTADNLCKYHSYTGATNDVVSKTVERGGSHVNTIVRNGHEYWLSEFCQNHNIRLVIGGHKHTQAITWPLKENVTYDDNVRTVNSMMPIIQVTPNDLQNEFGGSTSLKEITNGSLAGYKYPDKWFNGDMLLTTTVGRYTPSIDAYFACFELVDSYEDITAPVYAMSQATGYKHTSNKELPSDKGLAWEHYYHPKNGTKPNNSQKYPFFTVWNITPTQITGTVKKIDGLFNNGGTFNINVEGVNAKRGISNSTSVSVPTGVNGLSNQSVGTEEKLIIKRKNS